MAPDSEVTHRHVTGSDPPLLVARGGAGPHHSGLWGSAGGAGWYAPDVTRGRAGAWRHAGLWARCWWSLAAWAAG